MCIGSPLKRPVQANLNKDSKLYGFILGPGGLVDHNYMELTADIIDEYRN